MIGVPTKFLKYFDLDVLFWIGSVAIIKFVVWLPFLMPVIIFSRDFRVVGKGIRNLILITRDRFFLKCRVLINNSFITNSRLFFYSHMWDILQVFKVAGLIDELILKKHYMMPTMVFFAVMAASSLALVACEYNFLSMVLTIRLRMGLLMKVMSRRTFDSGNLILICLALLILTGVSVGVTYFCSRVKRLLARQGTQKRLWLNGCYLIIWIHRISKFMKEIFSLVNMQIWFCKLIK